MTSRHGRHVTRLLACVLMAVSGLFAGNSPAVAVDSFSWSPTDAFVAAASPQNPGSDSYGNPSTWRFMQGVGLNTDTYKLLPLYNSASCGIAADESFSDPSGLPTAFYNGTGSDLVQTQGNCSSTFTIPNKSFGVHPYFNDAIVDWTSPIDADIAVAGGLSDADINGGNGVSWTLAVLRPGTGSVAVKLASGSLPNGGSSNLDASSAAPPVNLAKIAVTKGTRIILDVNDAGDPNFDATDVTLNLSSGAVAKALPNLDGGTFYQSFQGSGNVAGAEECTNAFNALDPQGRSFTLSAKHCIDDPNSDQNLNRTVAGKQPMTLTTSLSGTSSNINGALRIATGIDCSPPSSPIVPKSRAPIYAGKQQVPGGNCILPSDNPAPPNGDMYAFMPDAPTALSSRVQTAKGVQSVLGEEPMTQVILANEQLCHYGAGSAHLLNPPQPEHCGHLWSTTPRSSGAYDLAAPAVHGDSGGPVYVYKYNKKGVLLGVRAVGLVQDQDRHCTIASIGCQDVTVFLPIHVVLNRLGLTLK